MSGKHLPRCSPPLKSAPPFWQLPWLLACSHAHRVPWSRSVYRSWLQRPLGKCRRGPLGKCGPAVALSAAHRVLHMAASLPCTGATLADSCVLGWCGRGRPCKPHPRCSPGTLGQPSATSSCHPARDSVELLWYLACYPLHRTRQYGMRACSVPALSVRPCCAKWTAAQLCVNSLTCVPGLPVAEAPLGEGRWDCSARVLVLLHQWYTRTL